LELTGAQGKVEVRLRGGDGASVEGIAHDTI
jgi:hypothetical protein